MEKFKPKFNRVLMVCHHDTVTGGPEAMHQLCSTLRSIGCESSIIYYSDLINISETHAYSIEPSEKIKSAYKKYDTIYENSLTLNDNDIIIFPEIYAKITTSKFICKIGIWWLSVDNAINWNPILKYKHISQPIFTNKDIIHFYQSEYAHRYLMENTAKIIVPLFDYTAIETRTDNSNHINEKVYDIAIFPNKGGQLAADFLAKEPDLKYIQILNMSKEQVSTSLSDTKIYIDFGNQPGKDRVPREAAACGCLVFLHRQGSAAYYEDSPLDDFFLFTSDDISSGNLSGRIKFALDNMHEIKAFQDYYKNKIKNEKNEFKFQCINFFTIP
jgi:hypothetical protein